MTVIKLIIINCRRWSHRRSNRETPPPGGGVLLIDRDDRRIFRGCNRRFSIFLGVVQAKSIKKIKPVFVRCKNFELS